MESTIDLKHPLPKKAKAKAKRKPKVPLGKLKLVKSKKKKPAVKKTKPAVKKTKKEKFVPVKFDYKTLSADILAKRTKEDLSFSDVLKSHGIPRHILFSIEAGKMIPSCVNFAAVLTWLKKPASVYFVVIKKSKIK